MEPVAGVPEAFFAGDARAQQLFATVREAVERLGEASIGVGTSQIAFRRGRTFAAVWRPARYLHGPAAPLVLTVFLPFRDGSPRWKEVVEPAPGRFTHHLELRRGADVDAEVEGWLRRGWEAAG
jgi:hypothetical protein